MQRHAAVMAFGALFASTVLVFSAGAGNEEAVKKDLAVLKGAWAVISVEKDGKKLPDAQLKALVVRFEENGRASGARGDNTLFEATFRIDPTKTPKRIDAVQTSEGENKGKATPGIYEVKGDTLRTCIAEPGRERPTAFSATPGSGYTLRVYQRVMK
jgi:uncharacterized protein (TIGR03067 family)